MVPENKILRRSDLLDIFDCSESYGTYIIEMMVDDGRLKRVKMGHYIKEG
jgi:hypothetical protein